MEPITRKEKYLAKLNGQDISIDPPITNEEYYLAYLCGEDYGLPTPVTLDEMYLAAMCGVIYVLPMPITRLQRIWKQLIETGETDITPGTREELYWVGVDLWDIVYSTVSGNPVMFTAIHPAPLRQLQVAFSPVQDLHGYDAPWPAGGGKNKFDPAPYAAYLQADGAYKLTGSQATAIHINIPESMVGVYCCFSVKFNLTDSGTLTWMRARANVNGSNINGSQIANGNTGTSFVDFTPASTDDYIYVEYGSGGGNNIIMSEMQLEKDVSGTHYSAYAPYSNLCPISGWSSLAVEQRGKNLLTAESFKAGLASITIGDDIDAITSSTRYIYSCVIPARSGVAFSIKSHDLTKINYYTVNRYVGRTLVDRAILNLTDTETHTNTYPADLYDYVRVNIGAPSGVVADFANADVQLELGTTLNPYEAGTGRSISISLGSTVYSGYVDVISGVGEVTMAKITKKWSEFANKVVGVTYAEGRVYLSNFDSSKRTNSICDCLKYSNDGADYGKCFYAPSSGDYFRAIVMNTVSDDDEFTFIYPLATHIPIQLTPQEVQSLLGENVMWSDANGNLTVTYRSN